MAKPAMEKVVRVRGCALLEVAKVAPAVANEATRTSYDLRVHGHEYDQLTHERLRRGDEDEWAREGLLTFGLGVVFGSGQIKVARRHGGMWCGRKGYDVSGQQLTSCVAWQ
jgi:hypothetical protein